MIRTARKCLLGGEQLPSVKALELVRKRLQTYRARQFALALRTVGLPSRDLEGLEVES
jgi:hypothetical protein